MTTGAVVVEGRPGGIGACCQRLRPVQPAWGGRGRDLSFFGFNLLHSDVRDIVAVAE